jgi:alpha-D-ribose 1-methylphosphonate 5-triphosphate synthase subunit PhnL
MLRVKNLKKSFTLHNQGGVQLSVLDRMSLEVHAGECVVLVGSSGAGKSTFLRSIYSNYKAEGGRILLRHDKEWVDMASAEPRKVLEVRKRTLGYVSQFLRIIPRVPALEVVMEKLLTLGISREEARGQSETLLTRLGIPERLWQISPTTFSGGEQQRINLARGFIYPYPILLLDEPTAALDARNRSVVVELIQETKARGAAIIGTFHDEEVRGAVATRIFEMPGRGGWYERRESIRQRESRHPEGGFFRNGPGGRRGYSSR